LEKLIQVPYFLPKLTDNEVETFLTLLFCKRELGSDFKKVTEEFQKNRKINRYDVFGLGDIQNILSPEQNKKLTESVSLIASLSPIITEGLKGNPRQIKRFLNTFTLRSKLVKVANLSEFKTDILAKLMVLEYTETSLFRDIHNWQSLQKGEPKQLIELEKLATEENTEEIKKQFSPEWSSEKVLKWLTTEPKLSNIDLRDYYWISRDQLSTTISGASLISPHIRSLSRKLIDHGSGKILEHRVKQEVIGKLSDVENENLLSLLEKELVKSPENTSIHKVFIEIMSQKGSNSIEAYGRVIKKVDNSKIPFSLRNDFQLAEKKNDAINTIYEIFDSTSQISKGLKNSNTKK
jgi:hypothetical protein